MLKTVLTIVYFVSEHWKLFEFKVNTCKQQFDTFTIVKSNTVHVWEKPQYNVKM